MAQILGLNGSPRKRGNTSILVAEVLRGAAEAGATTEAVSLGGLNIRECDGCHVCWSGRECPKADDMLDLYRRIGAADVIVFGTPVYWYGPTALMKALIDRCVYFNCPENRPLVRGTAAALVIPFEEDDPAMADLTVAMFANVRPPRTSLPTTKCW